MTSTRPDIRAHVDDFVSGNGRPPPPETPTWPDPPAAEAFYGLAGDLVAAVDEHTEADRAAVLVTFLASYGAAVGRGPHLLRGDAEHGPNEYVCLIGETAVGAKGTSWEVVRRILHAADPTLPIAGGIVSGEGVVHHVRDPREERRKARNAEERLDADDDGHVTAVVDEGASDKRALIVEPEFSRVLGAIDRRDNTLSAVLRLLWDSGDVRTLAKNSHDKATGAHVAIVAHVTPAELRSRLNAMELLNGFANRFVFACSRRSKLLPSGGSVPRSTVDDLASRVAGTFAIARKVSEMDLTPEAQELWAAHYERLRTPPPGILGAALARAAVHALRFGVVYALLDERPVIEREHVAAALAVWAYCERSVRHAFARSTGDPVADQILAGLRAAQDKGMTRTQIRDLLDRNQPKERVQSALTTLLVHGLARMDLEHIGGRPRERWLAADTEQP